VLLVKAAKNYNIPCNIIVGEKVQVEQTAPVQFRQTNIVRNSTKGGFASDLPAGNNHVLVKIIPKKL
jgi:hypothetical protein